MIRNCFLSGIGLVALTLAGAGAVQAKDAAIKVVLPAEPADIDACNTTVTGIGVVVKENVAETLTVLNPNNSQVKPRLATTWEDQGNGTWRVKLREGVKFHDGSDFNADAVVKAIERLQSPASDLPRPDQDSQRPDHRQGGRCVTPSTSPRAGAGADADIAELHRVSSPNTPSDQMSRKPVGTGPFAFQSWDSRRHRPQAERSLLGREAGDRAGDLLFRSESALRASMVGIGEADIAADIAPQDATDPRARHRLPQRRDDADPLRHAAAARRHPRAQGPEPGF